MKSFSKNRPSWVRLRAALLCGTLASASAAGHRSHLWARTRMSPIAAGVSVPPGYTTFYISGALPKVGDAPPPTASPPTFGDMAAPDPLGAGRAEGHHGQKWAWGFGDVGRGPCPSSIPRLTSSP